MYTLKISKQTNRQNRLCSPSVSQLEAIDNRNDTVTKLSDVDFPQDSLIVWWLDWSVGYLQLICGEWTDIDCDMNFYFITIDNPSEYLWMQIWLSILLTESVLLWFPCTGCSLACLHFVTDLKLLVWTMKLFT